MDIKENEKMKKVGILAYHSACNYGANLQILSTIGYLKKKGYEPFVINYEAKDFVDFYKKVTPKNVYECYKEFRERYMPLTRYCSSLEEIAMVINKLGIDAVIIGSDAVAQHHSWLERLYFPTKRIFTIVKTTSDRVFPNPFWGTFSSYLERRIPMVIMSASSQDSNYRLFLPFEKKKMRDCLNVFSYVSVRDTWTKEMYKTITKGKLSPKVTPDPVFAFNFNCEKLIPSKEYILEKYHLPEKYCLLSFLNSKTVSVHWLEEFQKMAKLNNIACVALPFPQGLLFNHNLGYEIPSPLNPLDWYALIKYSKGYIGHNMHPIVVCLHNNIPFFSFDNYGLKRFRGLSVNEYTSKIYHVLKEAKLLEYRVSCLKKGFIAPSAEFVFNKIVNFKGSENFSKLYYDRYIDMMNNITKIID